MDYFRQLLVVTTRSINTCARVTIKQLYNLLICAITSVFIIGFVILTMAASIVSAMLGFSVNHQAVSKNPKEPFSF